MVRKRVTILLGDEGGHMAPHFSLWQAYLQKIEALNEEMHFQFMETSEGKIA